MLTISIEITAAVAADAADATGTGATHGQKECGNERSERAELGRTWNLVLSAVKEKWERGNSRGSNNPDMGFYKPFE